LAFFWLRVLVFLHHATVLLPMFSDHPVLDARKTRMTSWGLVLLIRTMHRRVYNFGEKTDLRCFLYRY
ncbi:hypothetical protein ACJX0J_006392, partial [Zea mays]